MKKYNVFNNSKWALLPMLILVLLFTGCKKFLDTDKQGSYTEEDYPYPGGSGPYDQFIFAAYNDLRNYWISADGLVTTTSIRSDDADKGDSPTGGAVEMDDFTVLPSSGRCDNIWKAYYGMIDKCNSAIARIDTMSSIVATEDVKLQSKAEVRFIRGYAYFMMVRLFGNIPLIDTVYADVLTRPVTPQSAPAQIYTFIENDLDFAARYLPVTSGDFPGRVTRGSANGLLAKVYLTQKKWALAATAAQAVMSSGQYDLSTPFSRIFAEEGENSKESVFEVQATATAAIQTNNGVQYTSIQGVRGSGAWDLGWGWNIPSADLENNAYETGDPRKARTILYSSTTTAPATTIYGETMPLYPSQVPWPRFNNKVYCNPAMRASVGNRFGWWMNVRLLRYADVVLMYAEAQNELGQSTDARTALNQVRTRARGTAAAGVLPNVETSAQEELRQAIRRERRAELAMEHDRFFDLVRWGIASQVLHAVGKTNFVAGKHELLPIPQTQIDLSKAVLKQNPGY